MSQQAIGMILAMPLLLKTLRGLKRIKQNWHFKVSKSIPFSTSYRTMLLFHVTLSGPLLKLNSNGASQGHLG